MQKFQWNALRRGDHVLVHDADDTNLGLRAGVVTLVDTHRSGHDVGVRYSIATPTAHTVRPWRCSDHGPRTRDVGVGSRHQRAS